MTTLMLLLDSSLMWLPCPVMAHWGTHEEWKMLLAPLVFFHNHHFVILMTKKKNFPGGTSEDTMGDIFVRLSGMYPPTQS